MIRPFLLLGAAALACTPADDRALQLDGPELVVVDHYGPVRGPVPMLSDGSVPDEVGITVTPAEIASVEGLVVSAKAAGEATVDVVWKGQKASWRLRVDPRVTLKILEPPASLKVGERQPLHLQAMLGGEPSEPGEIAWSSNDPAIATVSSAGEVAGVAPGVAYITAEKGDSRAMVEIAITP